MVNFCLSDNEKEILQGLVGKKLNKIRHDPLYKFDGAVYGKIELFFDDLIVLIDYDYFPYPLFVEDYDDHPKFAIKIISESEAVSALKNIIQVETQCEKTILGITLVEDYIELEWDNQRDSKRELKGIIIKLDDIQYVFQGDYMIPLIDIISGENAQEEMLPPGYEYQKDEEVKLVSKRFFVDL